MHKITLLQIVFSCRPPFNQIVGTGNGDSSVPLTSFHLSGPTIIVLGNEGHGIRASVRRHCDYMVRIESFASQESPSASDDGSVIDDVAMKCDTSSGDSSGGGG